MKKKTQKVETIEEFLARGGKITTSPRITEYPTTQSVFSQKAGEPAIIMTYADADLYYGSGKAKKPKKKKSIPKIDVKSLPEALRNKYCKELLDDEI